MILLFYKSHVKAFQYRNKSGTLVKVPAYERKKRESITSEAERGHIIERYCSGESCPEIAVSTGYDTSHIWNIVRAAGKMRSHSEAMALRMAKYPNLSEHRGIQGAFHSEKNGTWIPTGSRYEFVRMSQLEEALDVKAFSRVKDRIPYEYGGRIHYYIPDINVLMDDGTQIVEEIKAAYQTDEPKNLAKFAAAKDFYDAKGIQYRIVTESDIGRSVIANFDWSGFSAIPNDKRREKERIRQRDAKRELERRLTPEAKEIRSAKYREYHEKRKTTMTPDQQEAKRRRNAESQRLSRAKKLMKCEYVFFRK